MNKQLIESFLNQDPPRDYTISGITKPQLAALRVWANRKGYSVKLIGKDAMCAMVSKSRKTLTNEIASKLSTGKSFFIEGQDREQFIRSLVSSLNKLALIKYKVNKFADGILIFPQPIPGENVENITGPY